jgi:CheY-like chemotaxis protein
MREPDRGPVLLFADDDPSIRHLLRTVFSGRGATIIEASNGAEAIEKVLIDHPSLMILDVMMPEISGWEVLRYVRGRAELQALPVVMLTGIGADVNAMTSPMFGATRHLDKPFQLDAIDAIVCELLAEEGIVLDPFDG